jgi:hypothetical protein
MSVSEPERHELYQAFEGLMGKKKAETMMALLPPVGWGDVATRRDLEAHDASSTARFEAHAASNKQEFEAVRAASKAEHEALEARLNAQIMRTALTVNIPSILAAVALSFAATRLG